MTINLKDLFAVSDEMNDKVVIKLLAALKDGQKADFDYLKFKLSYKSLCKMGMDESTAAKSAYLTASTMGLTKENLLQTVQHYKNILNKEKEQFALALKNQIANNIDSKIIEIKKMNDAIEANIRKMEQIEKEQVLIKSEIQKLEKNTESAKVKIEETRDKFKFTFDKLYGEVEEDTNLYQLILE